MTKKPGYPQHAALVARTSSHVAAAAAGIGLTLTAAITDCAAPAVVPPTTAVAAPAATAPVEVVERDGALRGESNKSAPQRCKVLGGSINGATASIVFEAELNGRRKRGIATVLQTDVRDHGDWVPAK